MRSNEITMLTVRRAFVLCATLALCSCSRPANPTATAPVFVASQKEFAPEPPSLESVLRAIAAEQEYAAPPSAAPALPEPPSIDAADQAVAALSNDLGGLSDQIATMQEELDGLREEVEGLRKDLPKELDRVTANLRRDSDRLRQEVARLSTDAPPEVPRVPAPGDSLENDVAAAPEEAPEEPSPPATDAAQEPEVPDFVPERMAKAYAEAIALKPDARPCVFTSVQTWGRTPEEAARVNPPAPSLKGMVGTVPAGSSPESLAALGRKLRQEFDTFDNIHIEVFDDPGAAQSFADKRAKDPKHHVLTISKDTKDGQDVVLLLVEGQPIEIGK